MRIGVQTWGSEGDIRPMVALGHGLVQRGHEVELVYTDIANRRYEEVAASLGMTARAVATPVIADENELYEIGLRVINASNPLADGKIASSTGFSSRSKTILPSIRGLLALMTRRPIS